MTLAKSSTVNKIRFIMTARRIFSGVLLAFLLPDCLGRLVDGRLEEGETGRRVRRPLLSRTPRTLRSPVLSIRSAMGRRRPWRDARPACGGGMCSRFGGDDAGKLRGGRGSRTFEQVSDDVARRLHAAGMDLLGEGRGIRLRLHVATFPHYEDLPSYFLIDRNLLDKNPVIARLRYPNGDNPFRGRLRKGGFRLSHPRSRARWREKGVYPLKQFGSGSETMRFYRKP